MSFSLLTDLGRAARALARTPGFSLAAIATLALGTGSTIAIGTLVYSLVWRPLPGFDQRAIAVVHPTERGALDGESDALSLAEADGIAASGAVAELGLLVARTLTLTGGEPERVEGASVSTDFFAVVGVQPVVGRAFRDDEGRAFGQEQVALLSHDFWQRRLGGDAAAVGRTIEINQRALTVVGVLPPGFALPHRQQIYLPWAPEPEYPSARRAFWTLARLVDGRDRRAAQAELSAAADRLRAAGTIVESERGFRLVPIRQALYDSHAERIMAVLAALVFALLAVACANTANLLLARAAARRGERAVRRALGASRWALARQLLAESFALAAAGCALGLLVGRWGLDLAVSTLHEELPAWLSFSFDGRLALACCGLVLAVTLLSGLLPALAGTPERSSVLLVSQRQAGGRRHFERALVSLQFGASFVVLTAALWLGKSVASLERTDVGFDPRLLLTLRTYLPGDGFDDNAARVAWRESLRERLVGEPGVAAVAYTSAFPADDGGGVERVSPAEAPPGLEGSRAVSTIGVSRDFFATLGAPLVAGEPWTDAEDRGANLEGVVVNRALAARLWPAGEALGRRLRLGTAADAPIYRVVGVAPDLPFEEVHEQTERSRLQLYLPLARLGWRTAGLIVRSEGDPAAAATAVRRAIAVLSPDVPIYDLATYPARLAQTVEERRLVGRLAAAFAGQALLLAGLGLFGVLAYAVARRTREIGVRLAVGATPRRVVGEIVADGLRAVAPGTAIGLALSLAAAVPLSRLLQGVDTGSPAPFVAALAALAALAAGASAVAARRAASVDPAAALRND